MEQVKKTIKEFFQAMGFELEELDIKKETSKDRELLIADIKIKPEEAKYFIREDTENLNALQHLLRVLISKKARSQTLFILDINNYRKEREKFLTELAFRAAEKVRTTKRPITLDPMPAYERRFIHLKLAEEPDIVTESIGQEPERKVVIRLYP